MKDGTKKEEEAIPELLWFFPDGSPSACFSFSFPVCVCVCVHVFFLTLFFSEICLPSMLMNSLRMRMSLISKHVYWPLIRSLHLFSLHIYYMCFVFTFFSYLCFLNPKMIAQVKWIYLHIILMWIHHLRTCAIYAAKFPFKCQNGFDLRKAAVFGPRFSILKTH